jgi:hypothetical protein
MRTLQERNGHATRDVPVSRSNLTGAGRPSGRSRVARLVADYRQTSVNEAVNRDSRNVESRVEILRHQRRSLRWPENDFSAKHQTAMVSSVQVVSTPFLNFLRSNDRRVLEPRCDRILFL